MLRRLAAALVCLCAGLAAAPPSAGAFDVDFFGFILTDDRWTVQGASAFTYAENWFNIGVKAKIDDHVGLYGDILLVNTNITENNITIQDQQNRTLTDPVQLWVDQAYLSMTGLGWKGLDVRIGKQRVAWGTADRFNPTDHLNPNDMHDPIDFGKKVPTVGVLATVYAGPITLIGVLMPFYEPMVLPITDLHGIFQAQFKSQSKRLVIDTGNASLNSTVRAMMGPALATAKLGELTIDSELPVTKPANMQAGFKIAGRAGLVDLSACYEYVLDDFGVPKDVVIGVPDPLNIRTINVDVTQTFPRLHLIGGDLAASLPFLWDVGVWAEGAYFIPQRVTTTYETDVGMFNQYLIDKGGHYGTKGVVIGYDHPTNEGYFKLTAGFDYTFPGAWYLNAQYVRGLPNEDTNATVGNYVFAGIDKPFFYESLKTRLFGGFNFDDHSWMLLPQITYVPFKSIELILGSLLIFGDLGTKFGAFGNSIMFAKAKVSFQ